MIRKALLTTLLLLPAAAIWAQTVTPGPRVRTAIKDVRVTALKDPLSITVSEKRIDLDLDNASLADAVKVLAEKSGEKIEIEKGLSPDSRITLHARNVTFGTALHLLAENAGVFVNLSLRDGKTVFHAAKTPGEIAKNDPFQMEPHVTYTQQALGKIFATPEGAITLTVPPVGPDGMMTLPPTLYRMRVEELRSTFTCPHCKGQVTALRTRQEPKCPKCGRLFQGDWQYCPADGTKRPAISSDWRFCPLCGHRVEIEKRAPEEPVK